MDDQTLKFFEILGRGISAAAWGESQNDVSTALLKVGDLITDAVDDLKVHRAGACRPYPWGECGFCP